MINLWAPLLLGIATSMHCVGMCGPLQLSFHFRDKSVWSVVWETAIFHLGRLSTYGTLGMIIGWLGWGLSLGGFQQLLSFGGGLLLLWLAFFPGIMERATLHVPFFSSFYRRVKTRMGGMMLRSEFFPILGLGMLNGLLPCGMVYAALAGAIAQGAILNGALFMILFGLGTLPFLLLIPIVGRHLGSSGLRRLRMIQPVLFILSAILLIIRGFNVDLPAPGTLVPGARPDCHGY